MRRLYSPFTAPELSVVLTNMKTEKAPGINPICAEMLQHLGPGGEKFLLRLANRSWIHAEVPHQWRTADIVPVFKGADKDPSIRKSYRPISLTSVVSKVVERLIKNRLQDHLERFKLLADEQAGYRTARGVEEHCVRLSQNIHDSLGSGKHVVLLSIDATAAFDRMMPDKLFEKMFRKGMPEQIVHWFGSFLHDRKARVRVSNHTSKFHTFKGGCPHGTVLGPLCWLIFIDDLQERLKELGADLFMYAEYICIGYHGTDPKQQYERAQHALDLLLPWAIEHSEQVSLDKTSVTAFAPAAVLPAAKRKKVASGESSYPGLTYGNQPVKYAKEARFLGVWFDEHFTFIRHMAEVHGKIVARFKVLKSVSGACWGCKRRTLRMLYLSLMQSVVDFALPAYTPFVDAPALKAVRDTEKAAAMQIGGCVELSRPTVIYGEAGAQAIALRTEHASGNMHERLRRLPADNPARLVAEREEPASAADRPRGWRRTALDVVDAAGLTNQTREPLPLFARANASIPLRRPPSFFPFLGNKVTRRDSAERRKHAALENLAQLPGADVTVYTDRSVLKPKRSRHGGGGFYLEDANGLEHRDRTAAGQICNSFRAESHALLLVLCCIADPNSSIAVPNGAELRMLTDSQSAIRALSRGPGCQKSALGQEMWEMLRVVEERFDTHVTVAYVPGHANLDGAGARQPRPARGR